jgi:hypothetical protein
MYDTDVNPLLIQRPTINPYRSAAYLIWHRLKWDLHPESWHSRSKINNYKNKYEEQKAVIVCNGPSLLKTDFSILEGTFTFGLNKINLLFDKSSFRPSCIVAVNPFVIEQNQDFYNKTDIPLFLDSCATTNVKSRSNIAFLHSASQQKFAKDCSISIYQGYTVTFVAMQLAFHMGFSKVALIGCDHNFAQKGPANMTVVAQEKDESHFDPKYFADGVKWQLPDLEGSEMSYRMARSVYNASGRVMVNCTEGGKLELLPRMSLQDFIADKY